MDEKQLERKGISPRHAIFASRIYLMMMKRFQSAVVMRMSTLIVTEWTDVNNDVCFV